MVELLLRTEQLQGAQRPAVIFDGGLLAQRGEAVARIFGEADHARLVGAIGLLGAVQQQHGEPVVEPAVGTRPTTPGAVRIIST